MATATTPRKLKWYWNTPAKNVATNNNTAVPGGGVVFGLVVTNLGATAYSIGIFDPPAPGTPPLIADLVMVFPLPASGSLIILPEEFAICEAGRNLCWAPFPAGDPTVIGAVPAANSVSAQFALA